VGTSTDGILAYGVDLQELDSSDFPDYRDADECDACAATDWQKRCGECFEGLDEYVSAVLKKAGITGVSLIMHCSYEYPMWILGTHRFRAYRGSPTDVPLNVLTVPEEETEAIRRALTVLGQGPKKPRWLLASIWG